ncbi:uncharacterized protein LOC135121288 [Zophobas morio]|uniref:uncharacterized protein LOC135121288 n=1 Tax=Zophobas morio TaxID=2755281 RepID=UPI003083900A
MKLTDRFLTLLHALPQEELLCMFSAGFKTNFLNSLVGLLTQEEVEKQSSLKRDLKDPPTAFVDSNSLKECKSSEKHTILKLISELINFEELHFKVLYNKRIIQNFHLDLTIRKKKLIKEEVQIILDDANALKTTLENNLDLLASIYLYLNSCSAADNFLCNSEELKMGISLLLAYQRDNIEHLRRIHSFVSLLDRNKVSLNLTDSHPLPPRPPDACICSIYECANSTFPSVYPPLTSLNVPNNFEELKPVSLKVDHEPSFQQESALTKSPERRASDSCLDRKSVEDDYIKAVLKELREKFSEKVNL